ncbi:aminotransferase, class V [Treponema phagedenis F0421]|uniref:cysteine desulfurase family protein n=1 Tax=Treponema phagedenis TaxID=162 RepID=UPI0001F639CA|nr:cysteine desulfurase family protein [Treponema phagedenis]EFW37018.1 aminotransferase, class V [Treponema phagedenis F0421]
MNVYLDWAATAIPEQEIIEEAVLEAGKYFANPSARHALGKAAAERLETARKTAAECLQVQPEQLIFTSGGTEANHIVLLSMLNRSESLNIAAGAIEHAAISEQVKMLKKNGRKVREIPVNKRGFITPEAVLQTIDANTTLVTVMAVNNETGAIQPIREIGQAVSEFCKGKRKIHFHVDAVQAFGKIPFELANLPISSAAMSGHKIGAPRGIGFLYLAQTLEAFLCGGGQEGGMRAGTENLAGIIALAGCLQKTIPAVAKTYAHVQELSDYLIQKLLCIPGISIIPETRMEDCNNFSPYIIQCTNENIPGEVLQRCLSDMGVYVSTGSACSSKKRSRPILEAMGIGAKQQLNTIRISLGKSTTKEELNQALCCLQTCIEKL